MVRVCVVFVCGVGGKVACCVLLVQFCVAGATGGEVFLHCFFCQEKTPGRGSGSIGKEIDLWVVVVVMFGCLWWCGKCLLLISFQSSQFAGKSSLDEDGPLV